jgi:UDP-N-acetyl-D-mannosaminuronic acid dehydrogenase
MNTPVTNTPIETVSVIGLGYVGLPTAAVVASRNVEVIGVEINASVVERINKGEVHIVEPDLDMLVQATVAMGRLRATMTPEKAQVYVIAVPTPFKGDHVTGFVLCEIGNGNHRASSGVGVVSDP